jgi:GT2 family glycosyltransferase
MDMAEPHAAPITAAGRTLLIVLSYHGAEDTIECLASIYRDKPDSADVLVVDNASGGGTVEALRAAFPALEIMVLAENRGWAGGNNAGITLALQRGYGLICLMNNDLSVNAGALPRLIAAAWRLGPCMLHPVIYDYHAPDVAQHDESRWAQPLEAHPGIFPMSYAYGACMMVHAELFHRVGLFDERFFLQLEEGDFFARAVKLGYASRLCVEARVLHKESVSFGGRVSPMKTYYSLRNQLLFAEKHALGPAGYKNALRRFFWSTQSIIGPDPTIWQALRWLCSGDINAVAGRAGIRDYILRRFGKMPESTARALRARPG